ncbi:MAG: glycine/sarcosine/betaine reductase component B subunit [Deltaproteobacteria bacterium]|nr:glycine/sarcosine/betaine reductase component B subunit [Deltaproteobacteria bacterium]
MQELVLRRVCIRDVTFGEKTEVIDHVLRINRKELVRCLLEDSSLQSIDIKLARPGEKKRIIPVKDVLEPRAKLDGTRTTFPGFLGTADPMGTGITCVLDGVAVVTSGKLVNFQEGLIDMTGPGAEFSLFSRKLNVVLVIEPVENLGKHEHEKAVREAGIKAAHYLGLAGTATAFDKETHYQVASHSEMQATFPDLPKVIYVDMVIAQGLLHDNYIYGVNAQGSLPVLLLPTELMDGAIVSGNCAAPCHKNTTYHQQNNPIVEDLLAEHGKTLAFIGVIAMPSQTALMDKERACTQVHKLAKFMGAQGAIVSEDGGGNPEADLMMLARLFEKDGIKTVLVTDEYAGRDGASQGLADVTPEADAIVTNGNGNQYVVLPPMEETIGHSEVVDVITGGHAGSLLPDGSIEIEIAGIMGSTVELGSENLKTIAV